MEITYEEMTKRWFSGEEFEFEGEKVKVVPGRRGLLLDDDIYASFKLTNGKRIYVKKPDESQYDHCYLCKTSLSEGEMEVAFIKNKKTGDVNYACKKCAKKIKK